MSWFRYICITLCLLLLVQACSKPPASLPASEALQWISAKEHGLVAEKNIGEISVRAQYYSASSMALLRAGEHPTKEEWEKALSECGNMQYFVVSYRLNNSNQDILRYNLSDESEYFARSNYLSFGIDKDTYVICGKDSLPCRLHEFSPHYGLSPKADIVFAFDPPSDGNTNDRILVIEDQLFGLGILRFGFQYSNIRQTPSIAF